MSPLPLLALSYLIGAIPTSYITGRLARGVDLREHGSGNLGASNTFRVLGWKLAGPVLLLDLAKGWVPTYFFPLWDGAPHPDWALGYAAGAVVGHVFSIYLRFRGGKGVATSAGALIALAPVAMSVALGLWLILLLMTRVVSIASIAAALAVPLVVIVAQGVTPVFWLSLVLAAFVIFAHRANIGRLLRGEELTFKRKERSRT
ncbi:MAG: glycerol-3-phosphate 1-O-acyltransferase PlsY [Longimicrobiales bacterium]